MIIAEETNATDKRIVVFTSQCAFVCLLISSDTLCISHTAAVLKETFESLVVEDAAEPMQL